MEKFVQDDFIPNMKNREKLIQSIISDRINENMSVSVETRVFARSVCRRNIHMISFGNVSDSPTLYAGTFHGMEWLTGLVLIKFAGKLVHCINNNQKLRGVDISSYLKKHGLVIIPCVNPDGVEISLHGPCAALNYKNLVYRSSNGNSASWQANARGVDLNHNFPAKWEDLRKREISQGINSPSPTRFGGRKPLSEPESFALTAICKKYNFRQVFAFHSQGEEIYWSFGEKTPQKSKLMVNVLSASSGYKIANPEGLAVGGGFKDWFISASSRPGFTIEIGKGKNPLPITDLEPIYSKIEEMLLLGFVI